MPVVSIEDLAFAYRGERGSTPALRGVTIRLEPGVIGVVGPNGAGKSTLLRLLVGLLAPRTGRIVVDGSPLASYRARHAIGFIPDRPAFEEHLTVAAFLEGLEALTAAKFGGRAKRVDWAWAELSGKLLGELSLGQARRVELAAALIGDPDLILLDEPTNGLDPVAIRELRQAVAALRRPSRTIFIASHHLDELQRLCDWIVVIQNGRVERAERSVDAVRAFGSLEDFFHAVAVLPMDADHDLA